MQVDFYHLTRDPAEKLVPILAQKMLDEGQRLLLVSDDLEQIKRFGDALWQAKPESFLAHGFAGCEEEGDQPILIADDCPADWRPGNGAQYIAVADGKWRAEALSFERAFYLFTSGEIDIARDAWRSLSKNPDVTPRYWKQDGGRWVEGP